MASWCISRTSWDGARDPFPLALTHGWPSSFAELLKLAPLLTDPACHGGDARDSFDVVIPSLPGYAFSAPLAAPGAATAATWASLWARLMTESLGYQRFGAQGQDIGAAVSIRLAADHPGVVAGAHLPGVVAFPPAGQPVSAAGQAFLDRQQRSRDAEGGYAHLQATRPQTRAAGLADSSAGLAAWIVEKIPGLERLRGRRRATVHQGRTADHRHVVLGHRHHRLLEPLLPRRPARPRPPAGAGRGAGRGGAVPEGEPGHRAARVGRGGLQHHPVDPDAPRRAPPGRGGAGAARRLMSETGLLRTRVIGVGADSACVAQDQMHGLTWQALDSWLAK